MYCLINEQKCFIIFRNDVQYERNHINYLKSAIEYLTKHKTIDNLQSIDRFVFY